MFLSIVMWGIFLILIEHFHTCIFLMHPQMHLFSDMNTSRANHSQFYANNFLKVLGRVESSTCVHFFKRMLTRFPDFGYKRVSFREAWRSRYFENCETFRDQDFDIFCVCWDTLDCQPRSAESLSQDYKIPLTSSFPFNSFITVETYIPIELFSILVLIGVHFQ
jgi:hypothetical protein